MFFAPYEIGSTLERYLIENRAESAEDADDCRSQVDNLLRAIDRGEEIGIEWINPETVILPAEEAETLVVFPPGGGNGIVIIRAYLEDGSVVNIGHP